MGRLAVDLRRLVTVMNRFKYLLVFGFLLACAAAFFSYVKVGPHGLSYRQRMVWISPATVLVTNPVANGTNATALATIYAQYAESDDVRETAFRMQGIPGLLEGAVGFDPTTQTPLPTLTVSGVAASRLKASIFANDGVVALKQFIRKRQGGTPPAIRPYLSVLQRAIPLKAKVLTPRSKTPPVFAFVLVLAATFGLVFLLENVRPRIRPVPVEVDVEVPRTSGSVRQASNS
jgi:capsular polysaccharide biosynthesis protein